MQNRRNLMTATAKKFIKYHQPTFIYFCISSYFCVTKHADCTILMPDKKADIDFFKC